MNKLDFIKVYNLEGCTEDTPDLVVLEKVTTIQNKNLLLTKLHNVGKLSADDNLNKELFIDHFKLKGVDKYNSWREIDKVYRDLPENNRPHTPFDLKPNYTPPINFSHPRYTNKMVTATMQIISVFKARGSAAPALHNQPLVENSEVTRVLHEQDCNKLKFRYEINGDKITYWTKTKKMEYIAVARLLSIHNPNNHPLNIVS